MLEIFERDGWCCVRCGTGSDLEDKPHHVIFRSQGGPGTVDNGVTVCRTCHKWAHSCRAGRVWFENFILSMYGKLNNGVEAK
nr:HNH endonuclease [Paenibacillus pseudetheri]